MRSIAAALIISASTVLSSSAADSDPVMGVWLYKPAQSQYSDAAQALERAFAKYEPDGNSGIRFSSEIHRKDGSVIRRTWTANTDGTDHPVEGDEAFDAVAVRRINTRAFFFLYKKAGRIVSAQVRDVSADGRTMTLTQLGVNASGATTNNVVIFERGEK